MFKTTEGNAYKSDGDFLLKYIERYDVVAVNTSKKCFNVYAYSSVQSYSNFSFQNIQILLVDDLMQSPLSTLALTKTFTIMFHHNKTGVLQCS